MGITGVAKAWWHLGLIAACVLLAAVSSACGGDVDTATGEKVLALEAKIHSLEESLEALEGENQTLLRELVDLRQRQADYFREQEAAKIADRIEREAAIDLETARDQQLAALEEGQASTGERLDDLDSRLRELEEVAAQLELVLPAIEKWFTGMDERVKLLEGSDVERTVSLAEAAGGEVYYIDYPGRDELAVLVMPPEPIEGNPLIVSLHGFGGNSAGHSIYVPLHQRVVSDGFGLLLPNGVRNDEGHRFWNPTDGFGKARQDDVAYLTGLVARAKEVKDFGPVYFFGYSNGGFMSYWMACQGLPGLRAVASLAGTSYKEDTACEGAAPVSVLHIHGEQDQVVPFHGSEEPRKPGASYAGAKDMFYRWGERAGCDPASDKAGAYLDLDAAIEGEETYTYRFTEGCAEGITVELWGSDEGGHAPAYGDAFVDALLDWLLAQQ